jgi:hypothetical protein
VSWVSDFKIITYFNDYMEGDLPDLRKKEYMLVSKAFWQRIS